MNSSFCVSEPFLIYTIIHNSLKQRNVTSMPSLVHLKPFIRTSKSSLTIIFVLASRAQSATSKSPSWNSSNQLYPASNGPGPSLSGQPTLPNACTLTSSKHLVRTPMAMTTLRRSVDISIARRNANISISQPNYEMRFMLGQMDSTKSTTLIRYSALTATGGMNSPTSPKHKIQIRPIYLQFRLTFNHGQTPLLRSQPYNHQKHYKTSKHSRTSHTHFALCSHVIFIDQQEIIIGRI